MTTTAPSRCGPLALLVALLASIVAQTGCADPLEVGCTADDQCRAGRSCIEGVCASAARIPRTDAGGELDVGTPSDATRRDSGAPRREILCLAIMPPEYLEFPELAVGQEATRTVVLQNCTETRTVAVSKISLVDNDEGAFSIEPRASFELSPGESTEVLLFFHPRSEKLHRAALEIAPTRTRRRFRIELFGPTDTSR
jgi:hypothetical protein